MSSRDAQTPDRPAASRLKPAGDAPILRASVEAKRVSDLCTGVAAPNGTRERILAWLADGAREVTWALCALPRERWAVPPPTRLSEWPALRHVRHLALRESRLTLPTVRYVLGEVPLADLPSTAELDRADASWEPQAAIESAEAIVRDLGEARFELLQRLETAPDDVWERPVPSMVGATAPLPLPLDWLMLTARQHELEHLAAIWRVALYWDRIPSAVVSGGLPFHPADRLEESH